MRAIMPGGAALLAAAPAHAQALVPDSGDTAWLLAASALALLLILPGFALSLAGQVRGRNMLSVMIHVAAVAAVASLLWALAGYSVAFAPGTAWTGGALNLGLANLALLREGMTVPESAFVLFQMMPAMLAPMLIVGAVAERARFGWVLGFAALWSLLVYAPVAHWIWGGGWLAQFGTLDFAGGIVVHVSGAASALVVALLIGKRAARPGTLRPHSPALVLAGSGLLWAGWLGLVGGASLGAGDNAASAMLNSHFAACAGALAWLAVERITRGTASATGLAKGLLAGLVTISPAAGMVGPMGAMAIGLAGGVACFVAGTLLRGRTGDTLDIFAIHGVGGIVGALLLAPFAAGTLGGVGYDAGVTPMAQMVAQAVGVGAVALWSALATLVISLIVAMAVPMRVPADTEQDGLDRLVHGEAGWDFE